MKTDELTSRSIVELAFLFKSKQVSPVEVITAYLQRIAELNPAINAIVNLAPDALDRAASAEAALRSGAEVGPLHGVPLTIKDTIATVGITTTSGSRVRENYLPREDATVVARLKEAGAIILGKTNTSELAIPYETDNPVFGRTNNPYDLLRTPGGSSGGEAAAIAACLSPAGIGSDLSGSIRVPAHFCGIVGLKPTSGRIPMAGHVPAANGPLASGACVGPMARRVDDVALLFKVLADVDPKSKALDEDNVKGLRVGWYDDDGVATVSLETKLAVRSAANALERAGLEVVNERPPGVESGPRMWIELFSQTSTMDLREFYAGLEHLAGPVVRRVLHANKRATQTPEDICRVQLERNRLREELLMWMETTQLILAPVGATGAFPHGSQRLEVDNESVSVFRAFSYAQTFNVFDLPSIVVRAGQTAAGLPLGVQIVGRPFSENLVLAAAAIVEEALGGWKPSQTFESDLGPRASRPQ